MHDPLRHEAMAYRGRGQFVSTSVNLLRDGLDRDERLIFLAAQEKVDDVREALGDDAAEVAMVATDEHGRNPSRITTMLDSFQNNGHDGRRALGVNETVATTLSAAALLEAQLAECVLNSPSLQSWPMSVVCLYDAEVLDRDSMTGMRRSHPVIRGEDTDNADYDAGLLQTLFATDLEPAPADAVTLDIAGLQLVVLRDFVRATAAAYGIAADRVDDLVLAANEIGTNSIRHGGGHCQVRMWFDQGSAICEIRDAGHLADPLIGRFAPPPGAAHGRGLWLANHLCDLVQIRSLRSGTVLRLFVDR